MINWFKQGGKKEVKEKGTDISRERGKESGQGANRIIEQAISYENHTKGTTDKIKLRHDERVNLNLPEDKPDIQEKEAVLPTKSEQVYYTGVIDLVIIPPIRLNLLTKLYDCLQTTPQIRVKRTVGSIKQGVKIVISLEKPMPLISLLVSKIPEIKVTQTTDSQLEHIIEKANFLHTKEKPTEAIIIRFSNK